MTSRACWLTVVTILWALVQGVGLLLAPASAWQSTSYDALRWAPEWAWAAAFGLTAALGLAGIAAHHAGRPAWAMPLTRAMAVAGAALATVWLIGFVVAGVLGLLAGFSAIGSWLFAAGVLLEATGMGGRRDGR